jgi:hypothetical protein
MNEPEITPMSPEKILDTLKELKQQQFGKTPSKYFFALGHAIRTFEKSQWINVKDNLPKIPKDKHGINVLIAEYDWIFAETGNSGYEVRDCLFDGQFVDYFPDSQTFRPCIEEVTHWMYLPEEPK